MAALCKIGLDEVHLFVVRRKSVSSLVLLGEQNYCYFVCLANKPASTQGGMNVSYEQGRLVETLTSDELLAQQGRSKSI